MTAKINGEKIPVPEHVGHKYIPLKVIPIDYLKSQKAKNHRRFDVFVRKGCKCCVPNCDKEGVILIASLAPNGNIHLDLYTKDFMLMTVDHREALGVGGTDSWENKFPMCRKHNEKKGQKTYEEFLKTLAH
jgi:5-methylcytosine-specific restriction endonuclease McrA